MKKSKGFTLIELMIVVAIIGILAAVAIPKFANLIRQANEASCKGNLGAIRSALSIYYGANEGLWPVTIKHADFTSSYMAEIPTAKPGDGTASATVSVEETGTAACDGSGGGGWWYNNGAAGSNTTDGTHAGEVRVNSNSTDTKGSYIHTW